MIDYIFKYNWLYSKIVKHNWLYSKIRWLPSHLPETHASEFHQEREGERKREREKERAKESESEREREWEVCAPQPLSSLLGRFPFRFFLLSFWRGSKVGVLHGVSIQVRRELHKALFAFAHLHIDCISLLALPPARDTCVRIDWLYSKIWLTIYSNMIDYIVK